MHRGVGEAELDHRAVLVDEAGVRGATGGGERGRPASHRLDRIAYRIGERPGLGEEHVVPAREGDGEPRAYRLRRLLAQAAHPGLDPLARVQVVVADAEARPRP